MKNGQFNSLDVKKTSEQKLGIRFKAGGEQNRWFKHDGKKTARITIPKGAPHQTE
jgi:hypothetical protein